MNILISRYGSIGIELSVPITYEGYGGGDIGVIFLENHVTFLTKSHYEGYRRLSSSLLTSYVTKRSITERGHSSTTQSEISLFNAYNRVLVDILEG